MKIFIKIRNQKNSILFKKKLEIFLFHFHIIFFDFINSLIKINIKWKCKK